MAAAKAKATKKRGQRSARVSDLRPRRSGSVKGGTKIEIDDAPPPKK